MKHKKRYTKVIISLVIVFIFGGFIYLQKSSTQNTEPNGNRLTPKSDGIGKNKAIETKTPELKVKLIALPVQQPSDVLAEIIPTKFTSGLFWKIDRPGFKASYLLGTAHSSDKRVLAMIPHVKKEFDRAAILCTELKLDLIAMVFMAKAMIYTGKTTLKSQISPQLYQKTLEIAKKRGISEDRINKLKPWAVMMTFSIPQGESGNGLDLKLYAEAAKQKKQLCGLEQIKEQISVFADIPLSDQVKLLQLTIDNYDKIQLQTEKVIQYYSQGDLLSLSKLITESPLMADRKLMDSFMYSLVIKRNIVMTNRMQPYLHQGNAFIAVGALHLPGKKGILQLLESMGYKVTKLY